MENLFFNLLPVLATVFLTICYVPQIVQTFKTKNVSSISLSFWILLNIALTLMLINATAIFISTGVWGYMVTEIANEGLAFIMLCLVLRYRNKDK